MRKFFVVLSMVVYAGMFSASGVQAQHVTKVTGSDVVINGESFFAMSNEIKADLEKHARTDGYIGSSESFRSVAVSGSSISAILNQYKNCTPKPKYLISDGGGIDFLTGSCPSPITADCQLMKTCKSTLESYLAEMKKDGTKKVLWMIYPDPAKSYATSLKPLQDVWAQVVPPVINACKDPKTLLVDLRPVWAGHYDQYTSDGIHPTTAGSQATADAFWKAIKDSFFFDTGSAVSVNQPLNIGKAAPSVLIGQHVSNNTVSVSLSLAQPAAVNLRITTLLGRTLLTAKQEQCIGSGTIKFPLGAIAPGVYCLEVQTGKISERSSFLVR